MTDVEQTPSGAGWFTRGRKFSLAGAVGAAALGVGAIVALPALTASPAYAVEEKDDGLVTVAVYSPEEAQDLERTLADHGIKAQVDFPPTGMMCDPDRYEPVIVESDRGFKGVTSADDGAGVSFEFTVDPDDYPLDGDITLVLEISESFFEPSHEKNRFGASLGAAEGEVGDCDPTEMGDLLEGEGDTEDKADDGSKDGN